MDCYYDKNPFVIIFRSAYNFFNTYENFVIQILKKN